MRIKEGLKNIICIIGLIIVLLPSILFLSFRHDTRSVGEDIQSKMGRWRVILYEEREKSRPLYQVEDLKADMWKPEDWDEFYGLEAILDGYIVSKIDAEIRDSATAITYQFFELEDVTQQNGDVKKQNYFYFGQSQENDIYEVPKIYPKTKEDLEEDVIYYNEINGEKMIFWRRNEKILFLYGNQDYDTLEELAQNIIVV